MTTADNDVTAVVLAQHQDVARRLDAVLHSASDGRAAEFDSLAALLGVHESAEETVIYPVLRSLGDEGARVAEARTKEEDAAKEILTKLKNMDPGSAEFTDLFTEFRAKVHEHAASEESEVLPLLTSSVSGEDRREMGNEFLASQRSGSIGIR